MEYRRLGKSGLKLSALSLGSFATFGTKVDESLAAELMHLAYDNGVNFFDNAELYANGESERIMGSVLKAASWGRDTFCVSSKVFWGGEKPTQVGLSRKHVTDACHAALRRLQVDYLDLYFCHRPDPETPIEETVWAMNDLVRQGKVLYWGTSEWTTRQISEAYQIAKAHNLALLTMEQPEYNLFFRKNVEVDLVPICNKYGLGTTVFSPLASGVLSGKYNHQIPKDSRVEQPGYEWLKESIVSAEGQAQIEKAKKLVLVAQEIGCSLAQLSIAWCLRLQFVSSVILGASKKVQLAENLQSLAVLPRLTSQVLEEIENILKE